MKDYLTLPRIPGSEPPHQVQFSIIHWILFFGEGESYLSAGGYSQCILRSADMADSEIIRNTSILKLIDKNLTGTTSPGQNEPGQDCLNVT